VAAKQPDAYRIIWAHGIVRYECSSSMIRGAAPPTRAPSEQAGRGASVLAGAERTDAGEVDVAQVADNYLAARLRLVEEHIRLENLHDLDGVMHTFGSAPRYDNEPMAEHHVGQAAVHAFYSELFQALPDLAIAVEQRYVTEEGILVEVRIRGMHLGPWRGLPGTGRRLDYPLCGIYTFDETDRLAGERIYYDRATIYRQLGIFHEPFTGVGRLLTAFMHPLTVARAWWRTGQTRLVPGHGRRRAMHPSPSPSRRNR
jgi:steroid delta-isomerase-like uncharacterized protein